MNRKASLPAEAPLLLDIQAAAKMLSISTWTVRELIQAGTLPTVEFPCPLNPRRKLRRKLIDKNDLMAFVAAHKTGGVR